MQINIGGEEFLAVTGVGDNGAGRLDHDAATWIFAVRIFAAPICANHVCLILYCPRPSSESQCPTRGAGQLAMTTNMSAPWRIARRKISGNRRS